MSEMTHRERLDRLVTLIEGGELAASHDPLHLAFNVPDAESLLRALKEAQAQDTELQRLRAMEARALALLHQAEEALADDPAVAFEPHALTDALRSIVDGVQRRASSNRMRARCDAWSAAINAKCRTPTLSVCSVYVAGKP